MHRSPHVRSRRRAGRGALVLLLAAAALLAPGSTGAARALSAPQIESLKVTAVTAGSATVSARVNFRYLNNANWYFSYCPQSECPAGTQETEAVVDAPSPFEEAIALEETISGLRPATTYLLTLHAGNDDFNDVQAGNGRPATTQTIEFRSADPVLPPIPVAARGTTEPASGVSQEAATLNGRLVPGTTGGAGVATSAFFEWGEGERFDHVTPARSFSADAAESPFAADVDGLTPNRLYTYRLVAVRGGQRVVGASQAFTTPQARDCGGGTAYRRVQVGRVVASGCFVGDGRRWVASGEVLLNGLTLEPQGAAAAGSAYGFADCTQSGCLALQERLAAGNRFYLDEAGGALGTTGTWKLSAGAIRGLCTCKLTATDVDWTGSAAAMRLGADSSVDLFGGFPLAGEFSWTPEADGSSRLGLNVGIPLALDGVTGQTAVRVSPGGGVQLDGLKVSVGKVAIKKFELGGLSFLYDRPEDLWEGSAAVVLPIPSRRVKVGATVTVKDRRFSKLEGEVDELNQDLGYGVFLQKVGVSFGLQPLLLGGRFGLSAGPEVLGTSLVGMEGGFLFKDAYETTESRGGVQVGMRYPPSFTIGGEMTVGGYPVNRNSATWYIWHEPWFALSGEMAIGPPKIAGYRLWGMDARVEGSLRGTEFSAGASGALEVLGYQVGGAAALINNRGVAACGYVEIAGAGPYGLGGWLSWRGASGSFWACGMGDLESQLASASASASAAGAPVPLRLHAGDSQALVRLDGAGGVPRVRLSGPGGRTIETPPTQSPDPGVYDGALALQDPAAGALYVFVDHPGEGRWTYTPLPGSVPVRRVRTARPLPAPRIRARLRPAPGGGRVLSWRLRAAAGQRVSFVEEGRGAPPRLLARSRAAAGSVRFRPRLAPGRARRVFALVEAGGRPRARLLVASYEAPPLPRLSPVEGVRQRRHGARVSLSWRPQPAALKYYATVVGEDGGRRLLSVASPRLSLAAAGVAAVTLRAVGFGGEAAAPRTLPVGPPPRLARPRLQGRSLSLRLSRSATVVVQLRRCEGGRCGPPVRLRAADQPAGTLRLALPPRLPAGDYRLLARAEAGGRRSPPLARPLAVGRALQGRARPGRDRAGAVE
jgi:hypothetical protein